MFCSFKLDNDNKIKISPIHYFLRLVNIKENWQFMKGSKLRSKVTNKSIYYSTEMILPTYNHVYIYPFLMKDIHTLPTKFIE